MISEAVTIHHELCDVVLKPLASVDSKRLKSMISSTLDRYLLEEHVPADLVHEEAQKRHGRNYGLPGYHLRLYRLRAELTQARLAQKAGMRQHHVSEMENNRRPIGKSAARKLARILKCDYRRLL